MRLLIQERNKRIPQKSNTMATDRRMVSVMPFRGEWNTRLLIEKLTDQ
jgi:hypothetical protein